VQSRITTPFTTILTETTFGIKINFNRESGSPSRVFDTMAGLVKALQEIDVSLVKSLPIEVEPSLILERTTDGSLISWFRQIIKLPTESPSVGADTNKIGSYLTESKFDLLELTKNGDISDPLISEIQTKFYETLNTQNPTSKSPIYISQPKKDILLGIKKIQDSLLPLDKERDQAEYIVDGRKTSFNLNLELTENLIEEILVKETIENENQLILKIKKPDYLGKSQWEFRHNNKTILVKLEDHDWLKKFHERAVAISPGDSMKAIVKVIAKYDINNEVIFTYYILLKVIEIIPGKGNEQFLLLP
jgi:hypothetical protein